MWHDTAVSRRLQLRYPIVQGPFGNGLSSVELLGLVSDAGGLGSFGVHHLPPAQIREVDAAIRRRTTRPYALNLWVSNHDEGGLSLTAQQFAAAVERFRPYYEELGVEPPSMPARYGQDFEEQAETILELRPPAFSFVFGIPSAGILERCRERSIVTIGAVTTPDEAVAMEAAGVDLIVASGFEAGGHRVSFLRAPEDSLTGTFALIPTVADRVKTPVIAAGGIADGRGIAAALTLGAQGVQIGSAFLACEQSGTSALHRRMLFDAQAQYTALTRVFSGRLARGIRNRFMEEMSATPPLPYPVQGWFTGSFRKAAAEQGRSDRMSLWAGQAAPLLRHQDAGSLFDSLVRETGTLLSRG